MKNQFQSAEHHEKFQYFHALHYTGKTLILPNAWDCISARMFAECGFPTIATTSAGVAWSLGYKDGEHLPAQLLIETTARICKSVTVPVSADIESGYFGEDLEGFALFIKQLIEIGVVGVNIEDVDENSRNLVALDHQLAKIQVAKQMAKQMGTDLFVNARTDAMEKQEGDSAHKISVCKTRIKAFSKAGADGVFVPFIPDFETVETIQAATTLPLNIMMSPSFSIASLRQIKVARVSIGVKPILATMHTIKQLSVMLQQQEDWHNLYPNDPNYPTVNSWF
ncbi:MAG: isocitrate lyase/phosphoenolpyruvate mutase family protein [Bacteroidetes bacterium]|nr:isocitrate lyase/phosphoenolpyruvate mutase family protein [Bacteroidota bacterium]MBS1739116.1 isocitrate lyase/phosphoenolpyruvate mutase family protein [Bacteroidota bacterium]